ncbi:MAG: NAD-dependent epimerase/dehydratase family protein [Sphingobacteriales bacterium]|nr:MAG: NAD-dependent epimerase/dehydratase family protein [Sphingobacteriales bacterium]
MNHSPTILVTGGTGFVGSHLLKLLVHRGFAVRATKRADNNLYWVSDIAGKIDWVDCDILDAQGLYDAMSGVKSVYHCAAIVTFSPSKREELRKVNVEGTANVVNMALERGVEKLLHVSSIAALGRKLNQPHVDETTQWEESPINTQYAISKYYAEREVWRGIAEGLNAVIVNPSVIIGEGEWSTGSCRLFTQVWEGLKFYPKGGTGFVDVTDLVNLMVELMNSPVHGERFIVNADNLSYLDFFAMVARYLNKPEPTRPITPLMAEIGWRLEALKGFFTQTSPLVTKETARMSQHRYYYQNGKLLAAIPYSYTPVEESVSRICKEFLAIHSS